MVIALIVCSFVAAFKCLQCVSSSFEMICMKRIETHWNACSFHTIMRYQTVCAYAILIIYIYDDLPTTPQQWYLMMGTIYRIIFFFLIICFLSPWGNNVCCILQTCSTHSTSTTHNYKTPTLTDYKQWNCSYTCLTFWLYRWVNKDNIKYMPVEKHTQTCKNPST